MNRTVFSLPDKSEFRTASGLAITRLSEQFSGDARRLDDLIDLLDRRRGVVLSSGTTVPGRYESFDLGFKGPGKVTKKIRAPDKAGKYTVKVTATEASILAAQEALKVVEETQAYLRVTAPFGGTITTRNVHPGALVGDVAFDQQSGQCSSYRPHGEQSASTGTSTPPRRAPTTAWPRSRSS